jgi:hypothetical protein
MSQRPSPFVTTQKVPQQLIISVKNGSILKALSAFNDNKEDPNISLGLATYLEFVSRWPNSFGQQLFDVNALDALLTIAKNQTTDVA